MARKAPQIKTAEGESLPEDHPRYHSLLERHRVEEGVRQGLASMQGLIAQGRGEAYDYLFGERTRPWAEQAEKAAAALLLLARHPIVCVNGNTAVLCAEELIALARELGCKLEVNLFYGPPERRQKIHDYFRERGEEILGAQPDAEIKGLASNRAQVDRKGIYQADVVLVSLEDGDRTEALKRAGKKVIAIDLNPLSRTPQKADLSIVDNVTRAIPQIAGHVRALKGKPGAELRQIVKVFDNEAALEEAIDFLRPQIKV